MNYSKTALGITLSTCDTLSNILLLYIIISIIVYDIYCRNNGNFTNLTLTIVADKIGRTRNYNCRPSYRLLHV